MYSSVTWVLARTRVSCSIVPSAAYLVPGTWYTVHTSTDRNQRYGGLFRAIKLVVIKEYLITGGTSRATPSSCDGGEGEAQFHVDPLRSTTLRGYRSARRRRGTSSTLNWKLRHALVSVILGKRGDCCRHRWTEASLILPDVAHDSRNQHRVVSLSALSPVSACVRLR